jgi:probable HAF family extracellular repeat protein
VHACLKAASDAAQHPTADRRRALTDLGTLGGRTSSASAMNDGAEIVGESATRRGAVHAFLWRKGRMRDLGISPRGFDSTRAVAINGRGQIVGVSEKLGPVDSQGHEGTVRSLVWLWENGVTTKLRSFPGSVSMIAINQRGQIIGSHQNGSFLWQNGAMIDLPLYQAVAINDRGQIIGVRRDNSGDVAVVWQQGKMRTLNSPGWTSVTPVAINDKGQIVARGLTAKSASRSFLWEDGKVSDLGTLGGTEPSAISINDRGEIVGWSNTARPTPNASYQRAFLWRAGQMRNLGTLGGRASKATAINERGQIIGDSDTTYGTGHAFVWENDRMKELAGLGGVGRTAVAINNRGQIVGSSGTKSRDVHAVLWSTRKR